MKFVRIPAGSFMMGSGISAMKVVVRYGGRAAWYRNEHPQHRVTITKPFYLQTTEVTQGQWKIVMGDNPSHFKFCGDDCPVEMVSWEDTQEFIKRLNRQEGENRYRLPTEAEWEYACRAGSSSRFCYGNDKGRLGEHAWFKENSGKRTQSVAQKKPNAWGLYDTHGNVWEWCQDGYNDTYYSRSPVRDPKGPSSGERVMRGGSWNNDTRVLRSAYRHKSSPDLRYLSIGFRMVRDE